MTEVFEPKLQKQEILNILAENIDAIDQERIQLNPTVLQQKLKMIYQALTDLNIYFLISPERLTVNFKDYLIRIFKRPPSKEIMEVCTQCINTALKSKISTVIQPSDFSFAELIDHVKRETYSDQTIINLLEIIFTISDEQWSKIANSSPNDIDIFFKYYDTFDPPSKINCLKCINNIVSRKVFSRFVIFLPKLLEIAKNSEIGSSIYNYSIQAFVNISRSLNKTTLMPHENFETLKYCEELCHFTSQYKDPKNLDVFIDSVRVCALSFHLTINIVFKSINLISYFECYEKVSILEAVIKLTLCLMPKPDDGLIELFPQDEFKWASLEISDELIAFVKDVIPHICRLYFTKLPISKLCIQALTYFVYSKSFQFPLLNQIVYMMHFNMTDSSFVPYILAIANECLKTNNNVEAILKTKLIERCIDNQPENSNICAKLINEIKTKLPNENENIQFSNFDELIDLISNDKLSHFDLFSSYIQFSKRKINHLKQISKILKQYDDFGLIEEKCQILVNFLVNLLSDIPIPITFSDPYFPDYNALNDEEIELQNEGNDETDKLSFFSILSEMNNKTVTKSEIRNLVKNDSDIKTIFDESTLNHNNKYTFNVLYRELMKKKSKSIMINNVVINDTDQFVISVIPQILCNSFENPIKQLKPDSFNCLENSLKKTLSLKTEGKEIVKNEMYKRNTIVTKTWFIQGEEIIQEIFEILSLIYEKDRKHQIQFYSEKFVKGIIHQLKFFFLSICLYSPCSQIMVKYPFLFKMEDRLYLFQLLTKEPLMAKEFYLKKMNKNYRGEKIDPFSKIMFVVHRDNLFKEGIAILEKFAKYKSFLEISFHDDVGFGAGTTNQFFDKMSLEFCKKRHRLWRRDDEDDKESIYVKNKQGIFPYATANSRYMHALGLFVAKSIQMQQVIDIPFNPAFFDLAAGRTIKMEDVDKQLAQGLYHKTAEDSIVEIEQPFTIVIEEKTFNLVKNGENILVTHENFTKYVRAEEDYVFGKHVKKKIDKFVDGFAEVLDPIFLKMFSGEEMIKILNGSKEMLTIENMSKFIVIDTGYDNDAIQIQYLKEILSEFNFDDQKNFIKYVTGSAYLPYGGLEVLDPPIKVARREVHDKKYRPEDCWPAAKTCTNQFLLPPYQSKEKMRDCIMKVISDPTYSDYFGTT